jgi:DNA-binding MarR family transcriptional regulator
LHKLLVEIYNPSMSNVETATRNDQALRLATAVGRLRTVLRDVRWQVTDLSLTQVAILRQLERAGPSTASALAAAEHISPQAIAQQLAGMKEQGYIDTGPDAKDGRKTLISLSLSGQQLLDALIESREAVLARAIENTVPADELVVLDRAIEVLERLADAVNSGTSGQLTCGSDAGRNRSSSAGKVRPKVSHSARTSAKSSSSCSYPR